MPIVFECDKEQIARNISEIKEGTMAYVGPLVPGIFDRIQKRNIEHIYTTFPEGKIRKDPIEIGGKTAKELKSALDKSKINVSDYSENILNSKNFAVLKNQERVTLVRLKVHDLGFENGATTKEIYKRAEELGLELCSAEVGPHYRLKYTDQPLGEWFSVAMKQIADRHGRP